MGVDVYDLVDAVDLASKYCSPEFEESITTAKTWNQKKELLEALINDSNVPKIKQGDFSGLARIIKKLILDTNAVVSQLSVKVCGNLAKGLRKDFEPCCKELLPALIPKFKEKKPQLVEDVHAVLMSFLMCTNLEVLNSDLLTCLTDKSPPLIKKNVCNFIEKALQETYIDVLKRISNEVAQALFSTSDDPSPDARDAACAALGIL